MSHVSRPQPNRILFLDPSSITSSQDITLRVNPPRREGIEFPERRAWEPMRGLYLSVIEDAGRIRMWYGARSATDEEAKHLCYAESTDGERWRTPELGLESFEESTQNNLIGMANMEGGLFLDLKAPSATRYRGVWNVFGEGLFLHTSPDGLRWRRAEEPLLRFEFDTQNTVFFDTRIGRYVGYVRAWVDGPKSARRRKVARWEAESLDHPFPVIPLKKHPNPARLPHLTEELPIVMECDEAREPDSDVYTNAVIPHPLDTTYYLAFPAIYTHFPEPEDGPYQNDGRCVTHFAGSTDGVTWHRYDRTPYAPPDDGEQMLYMGRGLIVRGDEYWQYGVAYRTSHGNAPRRIKEGDGTIVRFVQRRDRFVAANVGDEDGEFTTRLVRFAGGPISLNADAASGFVRVEIQDAQGRPIPGFELDNCEPISRDDTRAQLTWRNGQAEKALKDKYIRFLIRGRQSRVFGISFETGS